METDVNARNFMCGFDKCAATLSKVKPGVSDTYLRQIT